MPTQSQGAEPPGGQDDAGREPQGAGRREPRRRKPKPLPMRPKPDPDMTQPRPRPEPGKKPVFEPPAGRRSKRTRSAAKVAHVQPIEPAGPAPAPGPGGVPDRSEHPVTDADRARALLGSSPFDVLLGLELLTIGHGVATARLPTGERHGQPTGIVHGGVYASIAESVASVATNWAVSDDGKLGVGLSNSTNFLVATRIGQTLQVRAKAVHAGRSTWVWDVSVTAGASRTVHAVSRIVVAVIERRG